MLTISNLIRDLEPESWYRFKNDEIAVTIDLEKKYGVNEEMSFIINAINGNHLVTRWNRPHALFDDVDKDITSNQLADSEFLVENDSSLMIGRNKTMMAGLNFREVSDESPASIDDVLRRIDTNETREYLFQFRGGPLNLKYNYLKMDYQDDSESFVPLVYDTKCPECSFAVMDSYTNTHGTYEIWSAPFKPPKLEGYDDVREMIFKLVNPQTGKDFGSKTFLFSRNASLNAMNSKIVTEIINNKNEIYNQPEYTTGKSEISLVGIFITKGNRIYQMFDDLTELQAAIPEAEKIHFLVHTPHLFKSRSHEISENNTNVQTKDNIMEFLGFRFIYDQNRSLRLYDTDLNRYSNVSFFSYADETQLFYIKTGYRKLPNHNPEAGKFHYAMTFQFKIMGKTDFINYERVYEGGIKEINYKGDRIISSIPDYDYYPLLLGNMPTYEDIKINDKKIIPCYVYEGFDYPVPVEVCDKFIYGAPYMISCVDNICYFKPGKNIASRLDKIYESQFKFTDSYLSKFLKHYWPCDSLRPSNIRQIENTASANEYSSYYDLYGYIRLSGPGKVETKKELNHSVIKNALYFDGKVTGNCNTMSTWSNNGTSYSINFWIKTNQKTRGVILCDMDKEQLIANGVYIGIADGGYLEVGFNSSTSKIYQTVVANNEYRMITVSVVGGNYNIYLDGVLIDTARIAVTSPSGANKNYILNYQTYFMGHPRGKCVEGYISRIAFYGIVLPNSNIYDMYLGDIEHRIYGTVLASNMPFGTEVRFFDSRTGQYLNSAYSSDETGRFIYRNYDGNAVYLIVTNDNHKYGTIQVLGPLNPASVPH